MSNECVSVSGPRHLTDAEKRMEEISTAVRSGIKSLDLKFRKLQRLMGQNPTNWAIVGSAAHVAELLDEINEFLKD